MSRSRQYRDAHRDANRNQMSRIDKQLAHQSRRAELKRELRQLEDGDTPDDWEPRYHAYDLWNYN